MKYGKKTVEEIKDIDVFRNILESIVFDCVTYAGDSYENFSREVIKTLKEYKLVDYGD